MKYGAVEGDHSFYINFGAVEGDHSFYINFGAVEGDHSFYINFGVFQKQEKRILVVNMCAGLLIDLVRNPRTKI